MNQYNNVSSAVLDALNTARLCALVPTEPFYGPTGLLEAGQCGEENQICPGSLPGLSGDLVPPL